MKNQNLPAGNWMKKSNVIKHLWMHSALRQIIEKTCPTTASREVDYYNCKDLKNVIAPHLYQEMECQVKTLMIINHSSI